MWKPPEGSGSPWASELYTLAWEGSDPYYLELCFLVLFSEACGCWGKKSSLSLPRVLLEGSKCLSCLVCQWDSPEKRTLRSHPVLSSC